MAFETRYSGHAGTIVKDDRSSAERETHRIIVWGRDRFMSGWGGAFGGYSWAGWACTAADVAVLEKRIRNREDMQYVRIGYRGLGDRPKGRNVAHVHIYVHKGEV